ncbi:MAG: baseplate hub protein, partial [Neobacillus sp.]|nr:baseplate hub protein [Neobacillus sp.]
MDWIADKVFNNADDFLNWLDSNFGDYISKHISENHVHHTWKPDHSNYPKYTTLQLHKNMRSFHMNTNGWDDIAQNITIGKNGDIVTGRDIRKIPVSAKNYNGTTNWHPFAYEMIGNFDIGNDKLEGKQLESAVEISK